MVNIGKDILGLSTDQRNAVNSAGQVEETGEKHLETLPALLHVGSGITEQNADPVAVKVGVQHPQRVVDQAGDDFAIGRLQK